FLARRYGEANTNGGTLLAHHRAVADVAERIRKSNPELAEAIAGYVALCRLGELLHDAGKGDALRRHGHTRDQKVYINQTIDTLAVVWGLSPQEIIFVKTMVNTDPSEGTYHFRGSDPNEVVDALLKKLPDDATEDFVSACLTASVILFFADASFYEDV